MPRHLGAILALSGQEKISVKARHSYTEGYKGKEGKKASLWTEGKDSWEAEKIDTERLKVSCRKKAFKLESHCFNYEM